LRRAYWASLLVAIGLVLLYSLDIYYLDFMHIFSSVFPIIISGCSVVASIFALRRYWVPGSLLSRVWRGFSLGMTCWFLGELIWGVYTLALGVEIPYPSVADAFWLFGYVPLFIALESYLMLFRPAVSKKLLGVTSSTVSIGAVASSFLFIIPSLADTTQISATITNLAYPLLDLLLFAFSFLGLLVFATTRLKGKISNVWIFINLGILMNVIADSWFSYATAQGNFYDGHPLELFFHLGYLSFILAFYLHTKEL
jgi:hypothetical protein